MLHVETPPYIFNYVPATRPAFAFDVFDVNGNIIENSPLYIECASCACKHRLNVIFPPMYVPGRDKIIEAAKVKLNRKLREGELFASENNIGFIISLNIN